MPPSQSHGVALWREPARVGATPAVSPRTLAFDGANVVVDETGQEDVALYDLTGQRDFRAINVAAPVALVSDGAGGLRVSPTVLDRPHLDCSDNTPAGTNQRVLTSPSTSRFNQTNTSHTWAWLFRSAAPATTTQRFISISGTPAFSIFRAAGTGYIGFGSSSTTAFTGIAPPSDDRWHTIAIVLAASTSTATLYLDGVSVATAAYTGQTIGGATSVTAVMATVTSYANATPGRLGRMFYVAAAAGGGTIANLHTTLMAEDRDPANPVLAAAHIWDPLPSYGTQQLLDVGTAAAKCTLNLGRSNSAEPLYDPLWDGWLPAGSPAAIIADDGNGGLEVATDLTRDVAADLRYDLRGNLWTIPRNRARLKLVRVRGHLRFY